MAIYNRGNFHDFPIEPQFSVIKLIPPLKSINSFNELIESSRNLPPDSFELMSSLEPIGLSLKSIKLTRGFEGLLGNLFKSTNEVYFMTWVWDLSGDPVIQYPGININPTDVLINLKAGKIREFIGEGINLFPQKIIKGGLSVRIQIWESDQKIRKFGKILNETATAIQQSQLNNLLSLISTATGISGAMVIAIEQAAIELSKIIGLILEKNSDDYVDLFEGYYNIDDIWLPGEEIYVGNSSEIILRKY